MSNLNNLAHPYANALYDLAKTNNSIESWLLILGNIKNIVNMKEFRELVKQPKINSSDLVDTILQSFKIKDQEVINFLELLAKNDRLLVLPAIFDLFDDLVKQDKNVATAIIQSAFAMSDEEKNQFETILSKKFNAKINATVEINPALIGGIKVLVNNTVIDASIKGSLEKMAIQLTQ